MKLLHCYTALSACYIFTGVAAIDGLSDYVSNVPDCALKAFRTAMKDAGCKVDDADASDFDCLCDHIGSIPIAVAGKVEAGCSGDFAFAVGGICGTWAIMTTASDLAKATSILGDELNGKGADSPTATTESGSDATDSAETSISTDAAVATGAPNVARLVGGAAAVLVGLVI